MVVEGKIVRGDDVHAGVLLERPVAGAQVPGGRVERGGVDIALPVAFLGFLQFTVEADAGEAEIG
ncbi:hypothetical protein D3C87_1946960 [compost metagenome]